MNKILITLISLSLFGLAACHSKTQEKNKRVKIDTSRKQPPTEESKGEQRQHIAQMTFVKYLDDGDYFQILAKRGDSTFSFINETDTARNLNRGDRVEVTWRDGKITVPGDNDAEMPAQLVISIEKKDDGPVSLFRKTYGKKLKYTWSADEEFTSSYLDKVYLLTEYYLAKTANPLLKAAIKDRQELTYSIESRERNNRSYNVIGIATTGPEGSHIVQWLYIGDEEDDQIYEYDLPEDKLVAFD